MVREMVTVNVGECGINVGDTVWQQYCAEHNIECDGTMTKNKPKYKNCVRSVHCFFEEEADGRFFPRNLMISLDPEAIDNIENNSPYTEIYAPQYLMNSNEGSGHIFARGHYTAGKEIIDQFGDRLRKLVDNCDSVQGFVVNNCVSSGTGSGLTSLLLKRIDIDFQKKRKIGFQTFASHDHRSNSVIEAYNEILSVHWLLDHIDESLVFDNRKLYRLCDNYINCSYNKHPITYQDMNNLICKIESCFTTTLRFTDEMSEYLYECQTDLNTLPRFVFRIPSLAPLVSKRKNFNSTDGEAITKVLANPKFNQSLVDGFVRLNYNFQEKLLLYDDLMNIVYKFYSDRYKTRNTDNTYYDIGNGIGL